MTPISDPIAERLRQAVQRQPDAPYLASKIRRNLREYESGRSPRRWGGRLALVAAAVLICLGGLIAYQLGHLRLTTSSQESYIASISGKIAGILTVGLGDHVHCTVFRKFPKQPPTGAQMVADLGPEYSALLSLVKAQVPNRYTILMAHRCSYHGRKFVHLAMTGDSGLISVILTRKRDAETFGRDNLIPAPSAAGIPIYQGGVQRFAIGGFESRDHLVYVVSDLGTDRNLQLLASLAEPVRVFLGGLES